MKIIDIVSVLLYVKFMMICIGESPGSWLPYFMVWKISRTYKLSEEEDPDEEIDRGKGLYTIPYLWVVQKEIF